MTVLFPIITVKEILERTQSCKRKKMQTSTCTQVMEVLVISKTDAPTISSFI